ncbi:MAG: hypothetical protein AAGA11_02650 [Pseudomonadota bacterium]
MKSRLIATGLALILGGCAGGPSSAPERDPAVVEGPGSRLYNAVMAHFATREDTDLDFTEHHFAYTDLNNDGDLDVVVLLTDESWCVGDSCTAMIFVGEDDAVRLVSKLSLVNGPIALGDLVNDGWRDIYVRLPGRSRLTMARVGFNGSEYPNSPSQWGIDTVDGFGPGRLLLSGGTAFQSLYAQPSIAGARTTQVADAGESNAADMAALMAETDALLEGTQVAAIEPAKPIASASTGTRDLAFSGRYSWGPGEAFFRPCGGSSLYWVEAEPGVFADLDAQYRQIATMQYDDVFAVVQARRLPPAAEGTGSFYDGVLMVSALTTMEALDGESCSRP